MAFNLRSFRGRIAQQAQRFRDARARQVQTSASLRRAPPPQADGPIRISLPVDQPTAMPPRRAGKRPLGRPRVAPKPQPPARVYRNFDGLREGYDIRGGNWNVPELRTDAGIFLHQDMGIQPARDFLDQRNIGSDVVAAADTLVAVTVVKAIPIDFYITGLLVRVVTLPANLEWVAVTLQAATASIPSEVIFLGTAAVPHLGSAGATSVVDELVTPDAGWEGRQNMPIYVGRNTQIDLHVKATVGGAISVRFSLLANFPTVEGFEIPR